MVKRCVQGTICSLHNPGFARLHLCPPVNVFGLVGSMNCSVLFQWQGEWVATCTCSDRLSLLPVIYRALQIWGEEKNIISVGCCKMIKSNNSSRPGVLEKQWMYEQWLCFKDSSVAKIGSTSFTFRTLSVHRCRVWQTTGIVTTC